MTRSNDKTDVCSVNAFGLKCVDREIIGRSESKPTPRRDCITQSQCQRYPKVDGLPSPLKSAQGSTRRLVLLLHPLHRARHHPSTQPLRPCPSVDYCDTTDTFIVWQHSNPSTALHDRRREAALTGGTSGDSTTHQSNSRSTSSQAPRKGRSLCPLEYPLSYPSLFIT